MWAEHKLVMDYHYFTWNQLAADSAFREWVLRPTNDSTQFWTEFLTRYPQQTETVRQARRVVRQLAMATEALSPSVTEDEEEVVWQQLRQRIGNDGQPGGRIVPLWTPLRPRWQQILAVASVVVMAGIGWWLPGRITTPPRSANQTTVADAKTGLINQINRSNKPETITLADGSTVVLQPGSQLRYPRQFADNQRIVLLSGDGFFTVVRKSAQPFIVYAGPTVTRVLGTSFRVRAFANNPTVSVDVRTGRVSVSAHIGTNWPDQLRQESRAGVMLTPNQRAVFETGTNRLRKDLVAVPVPLPTPAPVAEETFDERPVTDVLARLEAMYGLEIRYDKVVLADCTITTTLGAGNLFSRLTLICQAIGANYTVDAGQIIIHSTGCTP